MRKWIIEKPLNEVIFKWYNYEGKEVPFGKHFGYLFEVYGKDIPTINVVKVELPDCDYSSNIKYPIVKIHCQEFVEELIIKVV